MTSRAPNFRRKALAFLLGSFCLAAPVAHGAPDPPSAAASFSGTWVLRDLAGSDAPRDAGTEARFKGGDDSSGPLGGLPLEALVNARWLEISSEGLELRISYSSGRKRVLRADGVERVLDEGEGPAKVKVERKGASGERVVVTTRWLSGRGLAETWELLGSPRRLTVTGKTTGRSYRYERVYDPAPARPTVTPTPTPTAVIVPGEGASRPGATPAGPGPEPSPAATARMADCSIRPPFGATPAELLRAAKIKQPEASRRAVAAVAPLRVSSVISSDVEVNEGCLVWPFDLRFQDKVGFQEVLVDAGDGKILRSRFEAPEKK